METRLSAALLATTLIAIAACGGGGPTTPAAPSPSPSSELAGVSAQATKPVAPKGGDASRADGEEPTAPTIFFISGACADGPEAVPQHAQIGGTGFTPNREAGLIMSANINGWTMGANGPCPGIVFEVGEPFVLPPTFAIADANGDFTVTVTGAECWVEALDLTACVTSNAVAMPPVP